MGRARPGASSSQRRHVDPSREEHYMHRELSRRDFVQAGVTGLAAGLAATLAPGGLAAQPTATADLIVFNGRLATQDARRSFATAVAIRAGRFVAVGTDADIMAYRGDTTQMIDVGGRTVIPGLNDSHMHPIRGGLNYNMELRWDGVPSLADALRMLREQAQRTPPPPVGARGGRLDGIPIRRAPHADARRDQCRRA
jgi:hypothetical protein